MNILMMTNTYTPLVGGLERSVKSFTHEYQRRGHQVLIVAPTFAGTPPNEPDVLRLPAIQRFNGSDFSVKLPVPRLLQRALAAFRPDIIHAHHPFLIGNTALRLAHTRQIPTVFTHHTLFEQYTHYLPVDLPAVERFVSELSSGYANLCDEVFAPSQSVSDLLRERGVMTPITVVPTGVDLKRFAAGNGRRLRQLLDIPVGALVVGHVGRLAQEKNLEFLSQGLAAFLTQDRRAYALIVGEGPSVPQIRQLLVDSRVGRRLRMPGVLRGQRLIDAYHAMDVFAFSSKSETQGLVVAEAMAAGIPVVALDAPGVREVVIDQRNGRLLPAASVDAFAAALRWMADLPHRRRQLLGWTALATARQLSMRRCADLALSRYETLVIRGWARRSLEDSRWATAARRINTEWALLKTFSRATTAALVPTRGIETPGDAHVS